MYNHYLQRCSINLLIFLYKKVKTDHSLLLYSISCIISVSAVFREDKLKGNCLLYCTVEREKTLRLLAMIPLSTFDVQGKLSCLNLTPQLTWWPIKDSFLQSNNNQFLV